MTKQRVFKLIPILIPLFLIICLYAPFFLDGLVQIHGDGVVFGVPMLQLLKQSLAVGELPLWTDLAYGGHPVFAESQIGALNPINMLIAIIFEPIVGQTVYHIVCMVGSVIGMLLLTRQLKISIYSSSFAAIALAFSTLWLGTQNNLTVSAAAMWTPFVLWSFERFWLYFDIPSACIFSVFSTLMFFSGYPHFVHGVAVYLLVRSFASLLNRDGFIHVKNNIKPLFVVGIFAFLLTVGLSAGQLLPLAELASFSHRSDGVGFLEAAPVHYIRGFLFTILDHDDVVFKAPPALKDFYEGMRHFNIIGSVVVCMLATFSIFALRKKNVMPHIFAVFVLINLGFSNGSPLFRFIYENSLLPGLHQFRIMIPYFHVAIVGFCVLAAFSLDLLSKLDLKQKNNIYKVCLLLFLFAWVYVLLVQTNDFFSWYHFIAPIMLVLSVVLRQKIKIMPLKSILLLALVMEVLLLRITPFKFGSPELLERPVSASELFGSGLKEYKHIDGSFLSTYGMMNPLSNRVSVGLEKAQVGLSPTMNVLWGVPSLDGGMALQLGARELIEKELTAEISDIELRANGTRIIDTLSVKYITGGGYRKIDSATPLVYFSKEHNVKIYVNDNAMPKFRVYKNAELVDSTEQALAKIGLTPKTVMLLECDAECSNRTKTLGNIGFDVLSASAMRYEIELDAKSDGWFFIADANYPGWNAYIDGVAVDVHSAQILGKSVYIPQGSQRLEVKFEPKSVKYGLALSFIALLSVMFLLMKYRVRPSVEKSL
jgi:hypothetical protein